MATTKSLGRKNAFDKFYTKSNIASRCINLLDLEKYDIIIEPSAGSGSFSNQIKNCIAYDICPTNDNIIKLDYLTYEPSKEDIDKKILVIGNPPFGVQNNLAISFFNHSAKFAKTIAFILPKSFRKTSIQNKLSFDFTLTQEIELPQNSFELNGEDYNVPTIFQIWERLPRQRQELIYQLDGISFVKPYEADFRIQRVGGNAGKAYFTPGSKQSNYFIRNTTGIKNKDLVDIINNIDYDTRDNTVGPRSISKPELLSKLKKILEI